ncbi:unnamed protein product [Paramecium pentaurelia]|uniref:Uncharacterized protein n=1 Tax=Paramecium pentaurelia TaxID=43138 RepID=A0A8S1XZC3_9CILI|nr:unnamed protein product [Paramecium pentaurelia]
MNHIIQQPKTNQKQKKVSKVVLAHPEIQQNKTLDKLESKERKLVNLNILQQINYLIHQHVVESLFKEFSIYQHQISLGSVKLMHDDYEFTFLKLQVLREMLAKDFNDHTRQNVPYSEQFQTGVKKIVKDQKVDVKNEQDFLNSHEIILQLYQNHIIMINIKFCAKITIKQQFSNQLQLTKEIEKSKRYA